LFVDVAAGSGFYADIVWMQESGITLGCGNDAYCASDSVTRAQMATFLVRALDLAPDAGTYTFGTVDSGDYDLEFSATGYVTEWYDNEANADLGSITVGDDEDVETPLRRPTGRSPSATTRMSWRTLL
jgi:hypothetical protein